MRPLPRWLGISIALHVVLAIGVWAAARTTGTSSSPTGGISVVAVTLVEASTINCGEACGASSGRSPVRAAVTEVAQTHAATSPVPTVDVLQSESAEILPVDDGSVSSLREPADTVQPMWPDGSESASSAESEPTSPVDPSPPPAGDSDARDRYRPLVLAILERAKRYPLFAQRHGLEGTVEIAFIIAPDGRLSEPEVIASSKHGVLDAATLAMVRRVGTVPPPPDTTPQRFAARIQYTLDSETSSTSTKGASP